MRSRALRSSRARTSRGRWRRSPTCSRRGRTISAGSERAGGGRVSECARGSSSGGRTLPAESIKVLEARYHLNDPFLTQYWLWLKGVAHGDFGISIALRENVS